MWSHHIVIWCCDMVMLSHHIVIWCCDEVMLSHHSIASHLSYSTVLCSYVRTLATMPTASKRRRSRSFFNVGRPMSKYPVTPWRNKVWRKKWWNCRIMGWVRTEVQREREREREGEKEREREREGEWEIERRRSRERGRKREEMRRKELQGTEHSILNRKLNKFYIMKLSRGVSRKQNKHYKKMNCNY